LRNFLVIVRRVELADPVNGNEYPEILEKAHEESVAATRQLYGTAEG
jgi:hypothetical protein